MTIFEKWRMGTDIVVRSRYNGKVFTIRPEKFAGVVVGYTIIQDGKKVKGYKRKQMDNDTFRTWAAELEEVGDAQE